MFIAKDKTRDFYVSASPRGMSRTPRKMCIFSNIESFRTYMRNKYPVIQGEFWLYDTFIGGKRTKVTLAPNNAQTDITGV